MKEISNYQNVFCKLSGMTTEANYKTWTPTQINPYMELVLNAFGTKRTMFGSDWPVCLVAGNYNTTKELVTNFTSTLSKDEQSAIMGLNAIHFYDL